MKELQLLEIFFKSTWIICGFLRNKLINKYEGFFPEILVLLLQKSDICKKGSAKENSSIEYIKYIAFPSPNGVSCECVSDTSHFILYLRCLFQLQPECLLGVEVNDIGIIAISVVPESMSVITETINSTVIQVIFIIFTCQYLRIPNRRVVQCAFILRWKVTTGLNHPKYYGFHTNTRRVWLYEGRFFFNLRLVIKNSRQALRHCALQRSTAHLPRAT